MIAAWSKDEINRASEPYHAGIGQLDLQLSARAGIEDRHRDEIRGRRTGRNRHGTRPPFGRTPHGDVRQSFLDTSLPVVEGSDADAQLPAERGDGQICGLLSGKLATPPGSPLFATRRLSEPKHDISPGIA